MRIPTTITALFLYFKYVILLLTPLTIYINCVVKDDLDEVVEVVTIDGFRFNLDHLINRIRYNEIIAFASTTNDTPVYRLVPREIGRKRTLRSIADESFRLEKMPECDENMYPKYIDTNNK